MGFEQRPQQINADVVFATQSPSKVEANKTTIQHLADDLGRPVTFDSLDPEIFEPESDGKTPDIVALDKTETLRRNVLFDSEKRTVILAFDVVTMIAESPEDFDAGNGEDLKRLLREMDLGDEQSPESLWSQITETLETEKVRMLERCTQGAFSIEWHIGFALNSSDGQVSNRGVLVLRVSFTALNPDVVLEAFALSEDLQMMRESNERPSNRDLVKGVKAFAIGPRLPFVKLIPQYGDVDHLIAYNRDYPEETYNLTPEQFFNLVRDCALTPHMALQLIAGSQSESDEIQDPYQKETVKLNPLA